MTTYPKSAPFGTYQAAAEGYATHWQAEAPYGHFDTFNLRPLPLREIETAASLTRFHHAGVVISSDSRIWPAGPSEVPRSHILVATPPDPSAMLPFCRQNRAGRRIVAYGPTSLHLEWEPGRRRGRSVIAGPLFDSYTSLAPRPAIWSPAVISELMNDVAAVYVESRQHRVRNFMWRLQYPSRSCRILADISDIEAWVQAARHHAPQAEVTVVSWQKGKTIREVRL